MCKIIQNSMFHVYVFFSIMEIPFSGKGKKGIQIIKTEFSVVSIYDVKI